MADEEPSPRPFHRERNLSNRNFNKRGSTRIRFSTESHNNTTNAQNETKTQAFTSEKVIPPESVTTTPGSLSILHSANSVTENALNPKSTQKFYTTAVHLNDDDNDVNVELESTSRILDGNCEGPITPPTPDPALLDVKQKLILFENLQFDERIIFKTSKSKSKSTQSLLQNDQTASSISLSTPSSDLSASYLVQVYPLADDNSQVDVKRTPGFQGSIDEEHSEDDVNSLRDEINVAAAEEHSAVNPEDFGRSLSLNAESSVPVAAVNLSFLTPIFQHSKSHSGDCSKSPKGIEQIDAVKTKTTAIHKTRSKDFPRNYRSRPKTEVIEGSCELRPRETDKFNSLHHKPKQSDVDDEESIELRDKSFSCVEPILEELIKTEESYVENLWIGIKNYGNIFQRSDLPIGLRGKKYVLFGNIEHIAEFHRDEFLPMLHRNKHDLKRIFDEFKQFIDSNCFYGYVLFTMNKQRSLKLCDVYKNYFKLLQNEIDDKLGINSFLVQPIQRMARYPLLLQQFITTLFKNRDYVMKPIIESCCRLEKRLRNLLITTNESEIINDIVCLCDTHEFNTFYQGKFRKVSEFQVFDHTLKRGYRSKVFIFDKCIIYTEIKGKQLIFHGRYPCEHIGITAKSKQFTLYYDQRKQQECDFMGDQALIDQWLDLIREMISAFAAEERRKLKELHSHEFGGDHAHRKPANLSLFRDSNRFSSDSGIGNIWVVPKPEQEEVTPNRTTWYAVT